MFGGSGVDKMTTKIAYFLFLPFPRIKRPCQRRQEDDEQAVARDIAEVKIFLKKSTLSHFPSLKHCNGEIFLKNSSLLHFPSLRGITTKVDQQQQ